MRSARAGAVRLLIGATVAFMALAFAGPSHGLTCGESGETPGVIESVLDGTHPRAERWQVIAAGTVTSIEPLNDDYGSFGAMVEMDVAYWFRGGDNAATFTFFDPPAGMSGVGFELGAAYLVLAADDLGWEGGLATGLCELTYRLPDFTRMEQLAAEFGATVPDTALPATGLSPWQPLGTVLLAMGGGARRSPSGVRAARRWAMTGPAWRGRTAVIAATICAASWVGLLLGAGNVGLQRSVAIGPLTLLERPLALVLAVGLAFVVAAGARLLERGDRIRPLRLAAYVVAGDAFGAVVLAPLAVGELTPLNATVVFATLAALGLQPVAAFVGSIALRTVTRPRSRPTD